MPTTIWQIARRLHPNTKVIASVSFPCRPNVLEGLQAREALNALCADAAKSLGKPGNPNFGDGDSDTALIATRDQLTIFLRADGEPTDVLCCVCKPGLDVSAFLSAARPTLQKISNGS